MSSPLLQTLRSTITPPVEGLGYELVELEWKREQGAGWILRLYIDRLNPGPDAPGIGHEDCTAVSREVSAILDVADVLPAAYHLEVSSPGVERPLRTPDHFRRFSGQRAKIRLRQGLDGRRNFSGRIVDVVAEGAEPGRVVIDVDGASFTIPLDDLDRANLVYEPRKESR